MSLTWMDEEIQKKSKKERKRDPNHQAFARVCMAQHIA